MPKTTKPKNLPLPSVMSHETDAVVEYLQSLEHSQRRPLATARLLVLAVKLHLIGQPWPTRPELAKHLGVSLPLVDVAISQRRAQGLITVVIEAKAGRVKGRQSTVTHRFIEPCPTLIAAVKSAERRRQPRGPGRPEISSEIEDRVGYDQRQGVGDQRQGAKAGGGAYGRWTGKRQKTP